MGSISACAVVVGALFVCTCVVKKILWVLFLPELNIDWRHRWHGRVKFVLCAGGELVAVMLLELGSMETSALGIAKPNM